MKPDYWDRAKRALSRRDPVMGAIMRVHPKIFLARRGEPFLTLARAIVGQQISVKAAQSVWNRIIACVPLVSPEQVLAVKRAELRACGLSDRKVEYIAELAQHFADGKIHLHRWPQMSDEEIIAELVEVRGIGRWTAEMFLIFNLRFADPSLTTEQIGAALLFLTFIAYHLGPLREALDLFYGVALMFGVLRLSARQLLALAMVALAAHGIMLWMSYLRDPAMNLRVAVAHYVILLIVLPWFALMGGYVNRLRMRLSDSNRDLKRAFDRIEQVAIRDELTGVYNRRFLMEALTREKSRADRLGAPLSVCMVDIDHFKSVNDTLGHAVGDAVLKHFAQFLPLQLRGIDVFGRWGGEEFLLVLPGAGRQSAE